jgi:hypothetical protein
MKNKLNLLRRERRAGHNDAEEIKKPKSLSGKIQAEYGIDTGSRNKQPTAYGLSSSKGQTVLLTHAILISFAVTLVFIVFTTLTTLRTDFEGFVSQKEIQQGCILVKGAVEKIYISTDYRPPTNTTAGTIVVQMPEKIAGSSYRLRFENNSAVIDAQPAFNTTCKIGLNLSYSGSSSGGMTEIKYVRYSNGTDAIEMTNV